MAFSGQFDGSGHHGATDAHEAGLLVHTWTFRPENRFLAAVYRSQAGENARHDEGTVAEM